MTTHLLSESLILAGPQSSNKSMHRCLRAGTLVELLSHFTCIYFSLPAWGLHDQTTMCYNASAQHPALGDYVCYEGSDINK